MRRIICFLMAICLLVPLALPVSAAEESATVTPRYTHIIQLSAQLDIDSSGVAYCSASGKTISSSYKVQLSCRFQGYTGTGWISLKNWTATNNFVSTTNQTVNVRTNYTDYRLWVLCQILDSSYNVVEATNIYCYDYYIP